MTTIPQAVTFYAARLVDARKKAYVASCIACWNQGQPFVSEWPNLAAEYITDIQAKLRKYGLTSSTRPVAQIEAPKATRTDAVATAGYRTLPETSIESYGQTKGVYKISSRDESAAVKAGWAVERRGSHYSYMTRTTTPRKLAVVKAEPSRELAKPVKVVPFKPQKLARYTPSKYAIEATLSGGNECYAGLITETMGGMPWGEAVTMYQSAEWQERNRAALTQARVYGLLAAPKAIYGAEAAG